MANKLFYGDNLSVMRGMAAESVDLIYLDPPFNSSANYNVLFRSPAGDQSQAQIEAFEDTWHWNLHAEQAFDEVIKSHYSDVSELLRALRSFLGDNDMMAYITNIAVRMIEMHRLLKPTGSIYLHCDPTASHYLKILMDSVFGVQNFLSEVIWKRSHAHNSAKRWGPVHDTILVFSKSGGYTWVQQYQPYEQSYIDRYFKFNDNDGRGVYWTGDLTGAGTRNGPSGEAWKGFDVRAKGRHWAYEPAELDRLNTDNRIYWPPTTGAMPKLKRYLAEAKGVPAQDVLTDIGSLSRMSAAYKESLGYPTQKPVALMERIIMASSREGDVVLDPFCGCGTTIHAAQKLRRKWMGIDITHLAIGLIQRRLKDAFGDDAAYEVFGTPKDLDGARALSALDKYQFQWWAVSLVDGVPYGGKKKGADGGIDGHIYFKADAKTTEKAIESVKGGGVGVKDIRELITVINREKARIGVYISLETPTGPMVKEAAGAGFYDSPLGARLPKIQLLTIEDLLSGKKPQIPLVDTSSFKKAAAELVGEQGVLGL